MAVSCFGNPKPVLVSATGILPRSQPQIRSKLPGAGETFKIADFYQGRKCSLSLNTKKAGHVLNLFLIFRLCCQFFDTVIQTFQLIRQLAIGGEVFRQDFLVDTLRL